MSEINQSKYGTIRRLSALHDNGALSEKEFRTLKRMILDDRLSACQQEISAQTYVARPVVTKVDYEEPQHYDEEYDDEPENQGLRVWSIVLPILIFLGLVITNPSEDDFKNYLANKMKAEVAKNVDPSDGWSALGGAFANYMIPELIEMGLVIDRSNFVIFSVFQVEPAPGVEYLAQQELDSFCVIGAIGVYVRC